MAGATNNQPNDNNFNKNTLLCDSSATSHMKNSIEVMTNLEHHIKKIIVDDGKEIYSTHIGTFSAFAVQKDGTTSTVILKDTYLVPDLWVNLFSFTKALTKGSKLSNQGEFITVITGDLSITFDRKIDCGRGHLLAVEMVSRISSEAAAVTMFGKMDINKFHHTIGHANEQVTRATAQQGIALRGTFEKCENCAISNIKKKNIPKTSVNKAKVKGERVYMDISSI